MYTSFLLNIHLKHNIGVYLSLKGIVYANNSIIQNTNIGQTDPYSSQNEGLQCVTDRMPCCSSQIGEWSFPDGTTVPTRDNAVSFYRNEGDDGAVNLNRIGSNVVSPTGLFCCVIPDATDTLQRMCATISKLDICINGGCVVNTLSFIALVSVQINGTVPTSPTVGQSYTLTCRIYGTDSPVTAYRWMKDGTLLSNEAQESISFSSIMLSDAGQYTCEVTVESIKYSTVEEITITSKVYYSYIAVELVSIIGLLL